VTGVTAPVPAVVRTFLMRTILSGLAAIILVGHAAAQGRARLGPTVSTISIQDGSAASHSYSSFGGTVALITGDDGEFGLAISRYGDLSSDACVRALTFLGVESNYYPVGAKGIAPFASTAIGLARVTESSPRFGCGVITTTDTTNQIGLGFGLGVRINAGNQVAALIEGRFFQVPNSAIQALEGRANVSIAFGKAPRTELLNGTLGPAVGMLFPLSGPMEARGPTLGVRFRRDTKKGGTLGLQIDYAALRIRQGCSSACDPYAILFAPGYEASVHPVWGRVYGELGLLLAGFPSEGSDRGIRQGAQGGFGADIFSGRSLMWNVNARALWLQRNSGANPFLLQLGVSLSPKLESR
jgi:opacity protein-like surface antigen